MRALAGRALLCAASHALLFGGGGLLVASARYVPYYARNIDGLAPGDATPRAIGPVATIGVLLVLLGVVLGPASLGLVLSALGALALLPERRLRLPLRAAGVAALIASALAFSAVALAVRYLLQPQLTFFTSPYSDVLWQLLGGLVAVVYLCVGVVAACVALSLLGEAASRRRLAAEAKADDDAIRPSDAEVQVEAGLGSMAVNWADRPLSPPPGGEPTSPRPSSLLLTPRSPSARAATAARAASSSPPGSLLKGRCFFLCFDRQQELSGWPEQPRRHQGDALGHNAHALCCGLLLSLGIATLTTALPALWNRPLFAYLRLSDPDSSLVDDSVIWRLGRDPDASEAAAGWVSGRMHPKLYLDQVVFFSIVASWLLLGAAGTYWAPARRLLRRRVAVSGSSEIVASVGECLLWASVLALFIHVASYHAVTSPRIMLEAGEEADAVVSAGGAAPTAARNALCGAGARVTAHLATLAVSLTLLPVPQSSVWEAAFGVPFVRAVAYHRGLGCLAWVLVTAHMALWLIKWLLEGSWLPNLVATGHLRVFPSPLSDGNEAGDHVDNFTVTLVLLSWALLTATIALGLACRRKPRCYGRFQLAHAFAAQFFLLTALVHAWGFWRYAGLGLVLLLADKVSRSVRAATRPAHVVWLSHEGGIIRLAVDARAVGGPRGFYAGQHAFLSVSELGLERHPFSIASSPSSADETGHVTFFIRASPAPGAWTSRLAHLARRWQAREGTGVGVLVDGPYGRCAASYWACESLVLLAGGAGITHVHSFAQDLLLRSEAAARCRETDEDDPAVQPIGLLRQIDIVWVLRDNEVGAALLEAIGPTLLTASAASPLLGQAIVRLHMHCTTMLPLPEPPALPFPSLTCPRSRALFAGPRGRPDLHSILAVAARSCEPAALIACGPPTMVATAARLGAELGMDVHAEGWAT